MRRYISLGLGVQSTWLYFASTFGYLPKADAAIFADLGKEKKKTLEYLDWLLKWADLNSDIPIVVIRSKNLFKDLLNKENSTGQRFVSIPAFTKNEDGTYGMLRRQCTKEYKIEQVDKKIRELCGLRARQKMTETIEVFMGVRLDEIERMSIPARRWKVHVYPFCGYTVPPDGNAQKCSIDYKKTRFDIVAEYNRHKLPVPPKSSCVFCPYQSDAAWYDMKVNEPEDFEAAVEVDEAIRNSTRKGIVQPAYLHDSCKPLRDVDFSAQASDLWKGECSGVCHL
jgi:hypothetical protein